MNRARLRRERLQRYSEATLAQQRMQMLDALRNEQAPQAVQELAQDFAHQVRERDRKEQADDDLVLSEFQKAHSEVAQAQVPQLRGEIQNGSIVALPP